MATSNKKLTAPSTATDDGCFFCTMKEPDLAVRRARIMNYLRKNYNVVEDNQELVLVLRGLWSIAMTEPDSEEFPSLGIFEFTANLIKKCLSDRRDYYYYYYNKCNIYYIPYYAAHIIGSYTMNSAKSASRAVDAGVIPPLVHLLRGKMTWIEQRVAVRALGHLASYESTFEALAAYEDEVVRLAIHVASTCVDVVYNDLVGVTDKNERLKYHCDLLTGGSGGVGDHADVEKIINKKAEEWTSQLQCWCLHILNCFAVKRRTTSLELICKPDFLKELCGIWGRGMLMTSSPAGIGLLRILCYSKVGRRRMAESKQVVEYLCNISRSSDDWQYVGIDCLLLLLEDPDTRYKVMEITILCLVDLIELREIGGRSNFGKKIIRTLLKISRNKSKISKKVEENLDKVRRFNNLSVKNTCNDQRTTVKMIKQQASHRFRLGKIEEAIEKYSEAIEVCPLRLRKERLALYSDRGQCHLLLRNAEAAISDTTRALCLSKPTNSHSKSLWIRSQAYDLKGLAKESLMDCVNGCFKYSRLGSFMGVPYYAMQMICKQMDSTWLFKSAQSKTLTLPKHPQPGGDDDDDLISLVDQNINGGRLRSICTINKGFMPGLSRAIKLEQKMVQNGGSTRRRLERPVLPVLLESKN